MKPMISLELKNLSFSYADGTKALDDISLTLTSGHCYLLKGPNGCGKSSLFRILNGLSFAESGEYLFDGTQITAAYLRSREKAAAFHSRIGYLFQDPEVMLFTGSVEDEIAFGLYQLGLPEEELRSRTERYLKALSLEHLRYRAPFNLSGGEKKRLALAAVLSMEPEVLIMDEPLNGLDEDGEHFVYDTLASLKGPERLLLIASHNDTTLQDIADSYITMDKNHKVVTCK